MRIAVTVATHKRPQWLSSLLDSLARLEFEENEPPELQLIVVDNDPDGSACPVVEQARERIPWPVVYDVEPEQGVASARNRAVALALDWPADFVVFIDDDEVVTQDWLDQLIAAQRRFDADVVWGAVRPQYEEGVPDWVVRSNFFDYARRLGDLPAGSRLETAATNNVLVSSRLLTAPGGPFDTRFNFGTSDTHFFLRASRAGARIIWAPDAVVKEWVPRSRARVGWLVQRAFRETNGRVWCERMLTPSKGWVPVRFAKALARIAQGGILLLPSLVRGKTARVDALRKVAFGLGALTALFGFHYQEYKKRHRR